MPARKEPRSYLITGGAGFVGSSIALRLKATEPDAKVLALDNLKRRGSELNLPRLRAAGVEFMHGDVREHSDLKGIPKIDALIECSAEPSVVAGYQGGAQYVQDTNLMGTLNCLDLVARDKADLLFLSTSRVYPIAAINGMCSELPDRFTIDQAKTPVGASIAGIGENFPLAGARTLYGATKLASELMIEEYANMHGFRYVVNRCGVIAGPWQMGKTDQGFILLWLARHHWKLPLSYIGFGGKGKQVRDVLHVEDLCDLVLLQLGDMELVNAQVLNVGGGVDNSDTLHGFTDRCASLTGNYLEIGSDGNDRPGDIKLYVTDNTRVKGLTGWTPKRNIDEVLSDSFAWLRQHEDQLRVIVA
ncbi:MAG: NAD-dependent epimerase/dehydratase family protein [Flavobacteriales bacterium]|nr:NAD-dependent epimerase/dehydratase family protein [Flavobacteriales bacterium]